MSQALGMHFLQDVFQMTAITFVSVKNHYHINGLHLFCDTQYNITKTQYVLNRYIDIISVKSTNKESLNIFRLQRGKQDIPIF